MSKPLHKRSIKYFTAHMTDEELYYYRILTKLGINKRVILDTIINTPTNIKDFCNFLSIIGRNCNSKQLKTLINQYKVMVSNGIDVLLLQVSLCCGEFVSDDVEICKRRLNDKVGRELFR